MSAGRVGMDATVPAADEWIISRSFELLDAPTDNPVAKSVNARNSDPTALFFRGGRMVFVCLW